MSTPAELSLDGRHFTLAFNEDFDALDVTSRPSGKAKWYSGLPYGGGYGGSYFIHQGDAADLGYPDLPFAIEDGVLRIRCRHANRVDPHWHTGLLSSVNRYYWGHSFGIGHYFECRAKMPAGGGKAWPAAWGVTPQAPWRDRKNGRPILATGELDLFEWYGHSPKSIQVGMATWDHTFKNNWNNGTGLIDVGIDFTRDFHLFGAYLGPDDTIFYVDRKELYRAPTHAFHKDNEFNIMVNNQIEHDWRRKPPPDPFDVWFDYVKVFQEVT